MAIIRYKCEGREWTVESDVVPPFGAVVAVFCTEEVPDGATLVPGVVPRLYVVELAAFMLTEQDIAVANLDDVLPDVVVLLRPQEGSLDNICTVPALKYYPPDYTGQEVMPLHMEQRAELERAITAHCKDASELDAFPFNAGLQTALDEVKAR